MFFNDLMYETFYDTRYLPRFSVTSGLRFKGEEEEEGGWRITLDLPGAKSEDFSVMVLDDEVIEVEGEWRGRGIREKIMFPSTVDLKSAEATLQDGVLLVRAPPKEEKKPKTLKLL